MLPILIAVVLQAGFRETQAPIRLVQTIPMPGVEGRIDHLAVDRKGGRLFVAALGNSTLEVIDLKAGRRAHTISGLKMPTGIAYLEDSNRIVVANGQGEGVDVFDGGSYSRVGQVKLGDDSDNVRYDAKEKRLYVGYGDGALGMVDAVHDRLLSSIRLAGHPESFQLEKDGPRIFVNVPTADQIAVVDRVKKQVISIWSLDGARANFPMALDEANRRLFVGCRNPAKVLVYDTGKGKVISTFSIAGDTDDLFYDSAHKRLYVSCGAGFIDVFRQTDSDHYQQAGHLPTAAGARTSLFVPELGRLYLAVPHRGSQTAEICVYTIQAEAENRR